MISLGERFPVIMADPPWNFRTYSDKGQGRSPDYPTMTRADIAALPVGQVAAERAVLIIWTTPQDEDFVIQEVIPSWGFTFKTDAFVWAKARRDLDRHFRRLYRRIRDGEDVDPIEFLESCFVTTKGYYSRKQTETCLLATTKRIPPRMDKGVKELIIAPRDRHSAKPHEQYARIERLFDGPYLELFGRDLRPGWTVLGNDIDGRDIRESLPELIGG